MKKVFSFFILLLVCMFLLPSLTFALTNYDVLQPIMGMPDQLAIGPTGLSDYLNTLVKVGVSLASGLAVIMIVYGGIQYTLTESVFSKEGAKKTIGNALLGLLLALTAYLILYTLNPDILSLKIAGTRPQDVVTVKAAAPDANIQVVPGGNTGYWGYSSTNPAGGSGATNMEGTPSGDTSGVANYINSLSDGRRSSDGSLIFSTYATPSDFASNPSGSALTTGNNGNVLTDGSVALSPDLISHYHPSPGQAVYVNKTFVGYYDDTAYLSANSPAVNTIDIYDRNGSIPSNTLKTVPSGQWNLTFGDVRAQVKK